MENFKSGTYINQGYYKSFRPEPINRAWKFSDMNVFQLLSQADRHLGRLDMYSEYVNIDFFVRMHVAKEATQSTKIEGTQTNIEEAFLKREEIETERRDGWEETRNYISAMNEGINLLHTLPFSSRLIRQIHKILLQGVRGEHKLPGEYRSSQNWIGGVSLADAVFVPPIHTSLPELMSDLERFANDSLNPLPDLLKIAIIHYQFETIHPFLDGNGRVGRLMITLYLVSRGILKQPVLYLSDFFEKHRTLYYDNLMRVRTHNDLNQWLKFFLRGVIETARKGVETFDKILQLQKHTESKIKELGTKGKDADRVIDFLYRTPVIDAQKVAEVTGKSLKTAYELIVRMEDLRILKEITGASRGKLYVFKDYLNLFY
ncbi:Fic family protein [Tannerella forsythia]|uniref:Fic family protein n=1 Tax=Tannerella forsythia TaxID=28112 RepID=UPI0028EDEE17|nr:Fic family protein [Tannerella forsythia]